MRRRAAQRFRDARPTHLCIGAGERRQTAGRVDAEIAQLPHLFNQSVFTRYNQAPFANSESLGCMKAESKRNSLARHLVAKGTGGIHKHGDACARTELIPFIGRYRAAQCGNRNHAINAPLPHCGSGNRRCQKPG